MMKLDNASILCGLLSFLLVDFFSLSSLAADNKLLIDRHKAAGLECGSCHSESPPQAAPSNSKCIGCHGDQAKLAAQTKYASPNPHAPPHLSPGETQACQDCHHVHKQSEITCTDCHRSFQFNIK
jgi:nitrate/TMAO reductase-like tetraheme cytochrome c subunit